MRRTTVVLLSMAWLSLAPAGADEIGELLAAGRSAVEQGELEAAGDLFRQALENHRVGAGIESLGAAESLTELAAVDRMRGDVEAARAQLGRARAVQEELAPGSLGLARTLSELAMVLRETGVLPEAEAHAGRAFEIVSRRAPGTLDEARVRLSLASLAWDRSQIDVMRRQLRSAETILERVAPRSQEIAQCRHDLGVAAWQQGNLMEAQRQLEAAIALQRELSPRSLFVANSANSLAAIALQIGDLEAARSFFEEALSLQRRHAPASRWVAITLNNLANLEIPMGKLPTAQRHLEEAHRIHRRLGSKGPSMLTVLDNLTTLARRRGQILAAEAYLQEAIGIHGELGIQSARTVDLWNTRMALSRARRDPEAAREHGLRALALSEVLGIEPLATVTVLNDLALVLRDLGRLDEAELYLRRSLEAVTATAPRSEGHAVRLHNLGRVLFDRGAVGEAGLTLERALEMKRRVTPDSLRLAQTLFALGQVAAESGEARRAEALFGQALDLRRSLAPGSVEHALTLAELTRVHLRRQDLVKARATSAEALEILESVSSTLGGGYSPERVGFRSFARPVYLDAIEVLWRLGHASEAFHVLERYRARNFLEILAERDLVFNADVPAALDAARRRLAAKFERAREQLGDLNRRDHAAEIAALTSRLVLLRQQRDRLVDDIRAASPRMADVRYPRPLDLAATRAALDPGTVLLSYSVGAERTLLFVVAGTEPLAVHEIALGADELTSALRRFHQAIHGSGWRLSGVSRHNQGRRLYRQLVAPAEEQVRAAKRLLILPDGPLHRLPFAALVRGGHDDSRYLVEDRPLHVALSATVYAELRRGRKPITPPVVSAFGDPPQPPGLAPLPYSRREVERIVDLLAPGRARAYLGAEASEENVLALGADSSVVHFATHATLDPAFPLSSGLVLAGGDGRLQVWEIFERLRLNAELVVLAACGTALGEDIPGEGMIGLTRAFQYAGARSVVASLWQVADVTTAELMGGFYRHLSSDRDKGEALRAAQLALIRAPIEVDGTVRDASAPYYWAAFQLFGDFR